MASSSPDRKRPRLTSPKHSLNANNHGLSNTARWCSLNPNSDGLFWDESRVKSFLSDKDLGDSTKLRGLLQGTDVSLASRCHPLLFDDEASTSETAKIRSLPFLRRLSDGDGLEMYRTWGVAKKRIVSLAVRDLYLAAMAGSLDPAEQELLKRVVDIVDDSLEVGCVEVDGMTLSFYPSAAFKTVKFVEDLDTKARDRPEIVPFFAQVLDTPKLFAVFVDPIELSFHNFENIVPLDRWLEAQLSRTSSTEKAMDLCLTNIEPVRPSTDIWTLMLGGDDAPILKRLAALDLYTAPLNKASRGGERFIFSSSLLSKALTSTIKTSGILSRLEPEPLSFAFVNYVFRCNRFQPGDAPFKSHLDTPYYDSARSQVSRYTLLIYLSPGRNEAGVLQVNDTTLTTISDKITCVILPQQHIHSGRPFLSTTKLFLRTELIFTDPSLSKRKHKSPQIASLFSSACYLTSHVSAATLPFAAGLDAHAHALFERANAFHWTLDQATPPPPPLCLHKRYEAIPFLTNGHDYWFPSLPGLALSDCALLAFLDYYNVKLCSHPFRSLCTITTTSTSITSTPSALHYLHSHPPPPSHKSTAALPRLTSPSLPPLFRTAPNRPFFSRPKPSWLDPDEDSEDEDIPGCCPMHTWCTFDAWKSDDVADEFKKCVEFCKRQIYGAGPTVVLGEDWVVLNEKCVRVEGKRVWFVTEGSDGEERGRVNFAACWGDAEEMGPELFVGVGGEVSGVRAVVPPARWTEVKGEEGGWHLVVDFWKNDWVVDVQETKMAVPVITNEVPEEVEEEHIGGKYWQRVRELAGEEAEERGELKGSYWTREQDELVSEEEDDDGDDDEHGSESHASNESGGGDEDDN
ncbi:hypothetical protein B0T18DRAFT_37658 [Schizothecium vesticola]|uniref:Uncharacterized protein n=1 Tax=Schizothecium vesticola TaxID=314040 RepID=A0AA40FAY7_9PEZI|nr:hypothetical protein B0T18DRAFT_37658 [Schizothecium vesticola]